MSLFCGCPRWTCAKVEFLLYSHWMIEESVFLKAHYVAFNEFNCSNDIFAGLFFSPGVVYDSNTTARDPTTCTTVSCSVDGTASAVSDCGPLELCQGNGR